MDQYAVTQRIDLVDANPVLVDSRAGLLVQSAVQRHQQPDPLRCTGREAQPAPVRQLLLGPHQCLRRLQPRGRAGDNALASQVDQLGKLDRAEARRTRNDLAQIQPDDLGRREA